MRLILVFSFITLTACNLGPYYSPPKNNIPDEWIALKEVSIPFSNEPPPILWWDIFTDPLLNKYIQIAAFHNNDVLKAEANILQARALRQVAAAPLYPKISVDFDAFHIFLSKNGPIDAFAPSSQGPTTPMPTKIPQNLNIFNNFIDATWEIDLFGKTRKSIEAAQAQLEGSIEQRNDILVSLFAEIARNYVELRSFQKQKMILERNIEILQRNVQIIQKRYSVGYSNLLDLEQINIQLNQAISALPAVNTTIYRSIFAISILIGDLPEVLLAELIVPQCLPELPKCLSPGLRSDLLRRRPDIRQAERNLAQATANIGVAVASFFPTVNLIGIVGLDSLKISNLYTPNSKTWLYGGDISMPLFQGGKLIGNLKIAEAQTAAIAFTYQQTVLNALRDTESALVAYGEDLETAQKLREIVIINQRLNKLNRQRHEKGLVSKLDELNSELILNNAELSLLQVETSALLDLITLYKSLGGGWEPFDPCYE